MPSLDILIPHFNDPLGLALSLRTVQRQSWQGTVRVVIVDDGSAPDSRRAVREIAAHSPLQPVLIENERNRGRPYSRNVLLDAIDSDYVSWLDAGDEWYSNKLAAQFDQLELYESAHLEIPTWITCNYDWAWTGRARKLNVQHTEQDQTKALLIGTTLRAYLWTLLGSAKSFRDVGWFDERLPRLQDLDYFLRFSIKGGLLRNGTSRKRPLCLYNKSDAGRNAQEIRNCNQYIFDKHRVLYNRYGEAFIAMRQYNMEMLSARFAHNNRDQKLKRQYLWKAFHLKPMAFLDHMRKKGIGKP